MGILELAEQGKIKRLFRTREKLSFPGAVCHITQRATGREPLFLEDADYIYMLHLFKKASKEFIIDFFSYTLMPNHLHLLIRLSKDNLPKAMKFLYGRYAIFFNKKYERKGHVFGGRFRQALCLSDDYLLAASLYIHLNAVKAHLSADPSKYKWSSCGLYVRPFSGNTFVRYKFILNILNKNISESKAIYSEMLKSAVNIKTKEIWENPRALEVFKFRVNEFLSISKNKKSGDMSPDFFNDQKLEKTMKKLKIKGRLRSPQELKARKFLIEQLRARGYAMNDISNMLGISRQAIYKT